MSELEFYDVVLELKSLSKLTDGFPIIYTEKGKEKMQGLNSKIVINNGQVIFNNYYNNK